MELPLRPLFASIALPALLAGVCACSTAAAAGAASARSGSAGATPLADAAALTSFATRIGVTCDRRGDGLDCITGKPEVGDYLDVELQPACTLQAVVVANQAELRDRAAPLDRRTIAMFDRGQPVCIGAIGRAGDYAEYYYVMAIADRTRDCRGRSGCVAAGDHEIHWRQPATGDCSPALLAAGQTRCAAGWLEAEDLKILQPGG